MLNHPTGDVPGLAGPAEHVDDLIRLLAEGFFGCFDDSEKELQRTSKFPHIYLTAQQLKRRYAILTELSMNHGDAFAITRTEDRVLKICESLLGVGDPIKMRVRR